MLLENSGSDNLADVQTVILREKNLENFEEPVAGSP